MWPCQCRRSPSFGAISTGSHSQMSIWRTWRHSRSRRAYGVECHRAAMAASGFDATVGVGVSRSGEGASAVRLNGEATALVSKQVGKHSTYLFSYKGARITQVSTKAWYAGVCVAGVGWLGVSRDDAPLCTPRGRSSRALCGTPWHGACRRNRKGRHKCGTQLKRVRNCYLAEPHKDWCC
jgi:hypothetical protein